MKDTGGPIKSYNIRWRMMKRSRSKHKPEKWNISSQQVKIFKFPSRYQGVNHAKMVFFEKVKSNCPECFSGDSDVGDFMMVTDLRCW